MSANDAINARSTASSGWQATLRLRFAVRDQRTFLLERQHRGPLLVQRPFYPEGGTCHSYIVHPPGGVVGGDELCVHACVDQGANALLTTPAAGKFYRSEGAYARLTQDFMLHDEASFEWLPQESIYYRGARVHAQTRVHAQAGSRFIGWEIACFGLPARDESFDSGQLRLGFELLIAGKPRWIDQLRVDAMSQMLNAQWGLAGHTAIGTLLAFPATRSMLEEIRELGEGDADLAVTLVDDVLVCRALGAHAEPVRRALIRCWRKLRLALLDRPAVLPRIWAT